MDNTESLCRFYENEGEEDLRFSKGNVHNLEYITALRYLDRYIKPHSAVLDSCAGSGAYAFYLAGQGHTVTAGDIVPYNVEVIEKKQAQSPALSNIYCGDALDLSRFSEESFDAVLLMGALYHMPELSDRIKAVDESMRVLKTGGILIVTYMNRHAVILNNISGNVENIDEILDFLNHGKEGIFFADTPSGIEKMMHGFKIKRQNHIALDGMACFLYQTAKLIDAEGFERWQKYHFAACEEPGLLGASYHNMFIAQKQ